MALSRQDIIEHVNKTLREEFEIPASSIQPERLLREDLELDSLDAVDMIVALEQGLKIRVDEEEAKKIRSVADIYNFVEKMLTTAATAGATAEQAQASA